MKTPEQKHYKAAPAEFALSLDQSTDSTGAALLSLKHGRVLAAWTTETKTAGLSPTYAAAKMLDKVLEDGREKADLNETVLGRIVFTLEVVHMVRFASTAVRLAALGGAMECLVLHRFPGAEVYWQSMTRVRQMIGIQTNAEAIAWGQAIFPDLFQPSDVKAEITRQEDRAAAMMHAKAFWMAGRTIPQSHEWLSHTNAEAGRAKRGGPKRKT